LDCGTFTTRTSLDLWGTHDLLVSGLSAETNGRAQYGEPRRAPGYEGQGLAQMIALGTHAARAIHHKEYGATRQSKDPRVHVGSPRVKHLVLPLSGTIIRGTPTLLYTAGNHHQHKPQRLMSTIHVKASSTQGTRSRLARAQPWAGTVVPDEFSPRPRASSSNGRTLDSPEPQLGQASSRSNLGQIASPTDRIAGAFNARIA
jgi:hypothetical protein